MRLVRDALGDDAIIVATREEEGGVRLTAAIDDAEEQPLPPPSSHDPEPSHGDATTMTGIMAAITAASPKSMSSIWSATHCRATGRRR